MTTKTSALREIIWLEIHSNPGITCKQVAERLGKAVPNITKYISELYKARLINRTEIKKPCNNFAGYILHYTYTAAANEYRWSTPTQKKQVKQAKPQPLPSASIQRANDKAREPDIFLTIMRMPVQDVLSIRRRLNEMFA